MKINHAGCKSKTPLAVRIRINSLELVKVVANDLEKRRCLVIAGTIELTWGWSRAR
jgi:hypothetical protein